MCGDPFFGFKKEKYDQITKYLISYFMLNPKLIAVKNTRS